MARKVYKAYADFETTVGDKPFVYSWGVGHDPKAVISKIKSSNEISNKEYKGMKCYYGTGIESYLKFCESIEKDVVMYFNNSKGFDAHFILPALDEAGYIQKPEFPEDYKTLKGYFKQLFWNRVRTITKRLMVEDPTLQTKSKKEVFNKIKNNWKLLLPNEYSLLVDSGHNIMEIKIGLQNEKRNGKKRKYRALIIRDNLSLFPTSISAAGKMLADIKIRNGMGKAEARAMYNKKDLKPAPVNGKPQKAYKRLVGYNSIAELEKDGNELDYLLQDIFILYKFQEYMGVHFDSSKWKMTIASTAYNEWIDLFGGELVENGIKSKLVKTKKQKKGGLQYIYKDRKYSKRKLGKILIQKILPTDFLSKKTKAGGTFYQEIYRWYRGGMSHVNEKYRGQFVSGITFLDINSSFPSRMVSEAKVPFGEIFEGDNVKNDFKYYELVPLKPIVNKNGLPFLYSSQRSKREYNKKLTPHYSYRFTSCLKDKVDKYYLDGVPKSDYKLTIKYSSKSIAIKKFFKGYVDKWYQLKEAAALSGDKLLKFIAKLNLNSLYGKFATKDFRQSRVWNQLEMKWELVSEYVKPTYYLPIGAAIAELALGHLVDGVGNQYENFVYCDTDSIAVVNFKEEDYKTLELNPTKLGAWDIEFDNGYGVFRRPKQYFIRNKKSSKLAFAGINFNKFLMSDRDKKELSDIEKAKRKLTLLDFVNGKTIGDQTSPKRVLGYGMLIQDIDKEIKPLWQIKKQEILSEQKYYKFEDFKETIKILSSLPKSDIIFRKSK